VKRKAAMKRSPMKRSTKPMRKIKPCVASAQRKQRFALRKRSLGRCEMEFLMVGEWARCLSHAVDPSHIVKRRNCGKARDLVDVVVASCRPCHERYEKPPFGDKADVRVPQALRALALAAIAAAHPKVAS
jgi:hypothetical protein